jgi:hypothetical protein
VSDIAEVIERLQKTMADMRYKDQSERVNYWASDRVLIGQTIELLSKHYA